MTTTPRCQAKDPSQCKDPQCPLLHANAQQLQAYVAQQDYIGFENMRQQLAAHGVRVGVDEFLRDTKRYPMEGVHRREAAMVSILEDVSGRLHGQLDLQSWASYVVNYAQTMPRDEAIESINNHLAGDLQTWTDDPHVHAAAVRLYETAMRKSDSFVEQTAA